MPSSASKSPASDYFNDLSQDGESSNKRARSPKENESKEQSPEGGEGWVPRPKRIACILCRKRKLRCDGNKPSCGTCSRLGHDCAYDVVRKKSGPKRGYVKLLEARLSTMTTRQFGVLLADDCALCRTGRNLARNSSSYGWRTESSWLHKYSIAITIVWRCAQCASRRDQYRHFRHDNRSNIPRSFSRQFDGRLWSD